MGPGVRDAFPPPSVLCGLFTRFVWVVDVVGEDCTRMYNGDWWGRCLCARPCRPAGALPSFIPVHNVCIFGMETPLRGRSGGHTGTAPTIPNTHRRSAKVKTENLVLAVTLQALKRKKQCSQ